MNDLDDAIRVADTGTVRLAAVLSVIALVASIWTTALTVDDQSKLRDIEARLACLELPGPNDCGIDGR